MEKKASKIIYVISFFEGAAVMATELCGSKLISPYFGSSLYVWSAVIAITLGSLAAGYFYGGTLSTRENKPKTLTTLLLLAAIYMGIMPLLSNIFGPMAIQFSLLVAVVIAALLLLFIPMFLMGAASPVIISMLTHSHAESGKVSGTVYSVSTVGGIISTFLSGFFLIPFFGIHITLIIFASFLAFSLLILSQKKNYFKTGLVLVVLLVLGFTSKTPSKNCIYQTDGMLGKINVIDDTIIESNENKVIRKLLVNNVVQTEMEMDSKKSVSGYINLLDTNIFDANGAEALVLGLGGGLTSNMLINKGYHVDGVELDERIIKAAREFFFLNPKVKSFCDDARHFINLSNKQYEVVLIDVFKAEEQPVHVITSESLDKIKSILKPGGQLIINWHGYLAGERGLGTSILLNTLKSKGFNYKLCSNSNIEDQRNIVVFAFTDKIPSITFEINEAVIPTNLVNSDARPLLEKYNALANQSWRKNYLQYYYSGN